MLFAVLELIGAVMRDFRELKVWNYGLLCGQVIETKKMLTGFLQYLWSAKTGTEG
jgi:hypothetical protein